MHLKTLISAGFALVAAIFAGCSEVPEAPSNHLSRAVPVRVEPLLFERARARVEAVGTARARLSAELFPATSGQVSAVNFEPGQAVAAGDVLVELDRREQQLAVRLARLQLEDSERLFDRYQRSAVSGAVPPAVLDAARTAAETARVELERAEIALADRSIEAVFDGFVGATEVDPGDRVNSSTPITTLDDRSQLFISFDIPEAYIGELAIGDRVRLETWSTNFPAVEGDIVDIGSRIDPQTRTFIARARVTNEDDALRPGMSFRVAVDVQGELYAVVNETGLLWGADGAYIWSIVDGEAMRVPVQVIQRREGRVLVDGDLKDGDIVVVEGIQSMREGIAVKYDAELLALNREAPQLPASLAPVVGTAALD